jgi:two-component system nitrogen regulation sensor histidine kinase GlnL
MSQDYHSASPLTHFNTVELLDALATGVVVLDAQFCVVYANVGVQDLLGIGLNQARGRPFSALLVNAAELQALLRRSIEHGETCSAPELTLTPVAAHHGERASVIVDATVTPLEGAITGRHLLLELADARVRAQLTRENELLARVDGRRLMARQLAHEIKNPLGGLRGAAQLLERELPNAQLREYTTVILRETDRLSTLVDTMLGSSRPPQLRPLNIHEVCEHVYRLVSSEAAPGVSIERDYDPSIPDASLARDELVQALLNLVRNALQAVARRGRIVLRTRTLSNVPMHGARHRLVACLQVEDDGPGVPEALRDSLFMPLVTGRSEGTGLGLAVAQDVVSRHRGLIEYESRPGRTVFSMLLPLEIPG